MKKAIKGVTKNLVPVAAGIGGAVAAGYGINLIPIGNNQVKAGIGVLAGLLLMGQKGILGQMATGVAIGSGLKLAQSFGIGAIEDPIMALDDSLNGIEDPIMGYNDYPEDNSQDDDLI